MIVEYTINRNGTTIHKLWRDEATHERKEEIIRDYTPYFFIESPQESKYHTLEGIPVGKKYAQYPFDIKEMKEMYKHYEADLSHTDKYVLDNMSLPLGHDYLRTIYLDIETYTHAGEAFPDPDEAPDRICLICVYDSVTEEYYSFGGDDEYELLTEFAAFVRECDPDIITAWNADFDMKTIYHRMEHLFINPKCLSRFNYTRCDEYYGVSISGIDVLDLLVLYKKLNVGELESFSLTSVAQHELDIDKIDLGHDLPGDLLDKGMKAELEEYCLRDVELMVELDQKLQIVEYYHLLQRISGLSSISDTVSNSKMHDLLILRKAHESGIILPSKEPSEKKTVVGGRVQDPTPGVSQGVAVLDVVGLYTNIFSTINCGLDTLCDNPNTNTIEVTTDINTYYVDQSHPSLWSQVLGDLGEERSVYKKKMQASKVGSDDYKFNYQRQFALKTLIASAYGVSNFPNFRLYSNEVSDIITYIGREMNKHAEQVSITAGYGCIYGDTDSIFVSGVGSPSAAIELEQIVNASWSTFLADQGIDLDEHTFEIEYDAYYTRIFFTEAKKRYAGRYTHKNGQEAIGTKIAGFQLKRSDASKLTKDLQTDVFEIILNDPVDEIATNVKARVKTSLDTITDTDYLDFGLPKGLKKPPEEYGIQTLYTKGSIYSQKYLGLGDVHSVKPLFFLVKRVSQNSEMPATKTVAVDPDDSKQLDFIKANFDINWDKTIERTIEKPMEGILAAFDIKLVDIKTGSFQSDLFSF